MHSAPTLHYQGLSCVARLRSTWGEGVWDVAIEWLPAQEFNYLPSDDSVTLNKIQLLVC